MAEIEIRLFNSLTKYGPGGVKFPLPLKPGATVGEVLQNLRVPEGEIFLTLHNGRNIMRGYGFNCGIETDQPLRDGDILALSGPIPFSRGYGAPVV